MKVGGIRGDLDTLLHTLCIGGAQWIQTSHGRPKKLMVGKLKPKYRVWYSLATSRLSFVKYKSRYGAEGNSGL